MQFGVSHRPLFNSSQDSDRFTEEQDDSPLNDQDEPLETLRVAILHSDLGASGKGTSLDQQKYMLNMTQALRDKNYKVTNYRPNFHPKHSLYPGKGSQRSSASDFSSEENYDCMWGSICPRSILGRLRLFCAYLRIFIYALHLLFGTTEHFDIIVVDQTSLAIPILRLKSARVVFFCNNPLILHHQTKSFFSGQATFENSVFTRLFLFWMNVYTEFTLGLAHAVIVSSKTTQRMFLDSYRMVSVSSRRKERGLYRWVENEKKGPAKQKQTVMKRHFPQILYPAVCKLTNSYKDGSEIKLQALLGKDVFTARSRIILSINSFQKEKNLVLALKAYHAYLKASGDGDAFLILASQAGEAVDEEYLLALKTYAREHNLNQVVFLQGVSMREKTLLFQRSQVVLYTPENEAYMSLVPIEAMSLGCLVVACNSGGQLESISHDYSGFLLPNNEELWGAQLEKILGEKEDANVEQIRQYARERVKIVFSMEVFSESLVEILNTIN